MPDDKIQHQEFAHLYKFALAYAKISRSPVVELDDAIQEMLVMAITCKYKSREYVKRAMRNRYLELIRRARMIQSYLAEMEEGEEPWEDPAPRQEAKDVVTRLICAVPAKQGQVLTRLLEGRTPDEVRELERLSVRTVNRYIARARDVVEAMAGGR